MGGRLRVPARRRLTGRAARAAALPVSSPGALNFFMTPSCHPFTYVQSFMKT